MFFIYIPTSIIISLKYDENKMVDHDKPVGI